MSLPPSQLVGTCTSGPVPRARVVNCPGSGVPRLGACGDDPAPCDDGACCDSDAQCTVVDVAAGPPTAGVNASVTAQGFIEITRQKRTRENFQERKVRCPATVTGSTPGSAFHLTYADPAGTGCGTLSGGFNAFADDGIDFPDLACGAIGPIRRIDHTVSGTVRFDPKAGISALGVSTGLAKYDLLIRCGFAEVNVTAVCYRCLLYTSPSPRDS